MKLKIFKIKRGHEGRLKDSPFDYLLSSQNGKKAVRAAPPVVLRGSPDLLGPFLKVVPSVTPYTSGVLSFEESIERLRPFLEGVMTAFENLASVPSPARQPWCWVMHQTPSGLNSKGNTVPKVELHFIVGNIDLETGRHSRLFFSGASSDNALRRNFQNFINITCNLTAPGERVRSDVETFACPRLRAERERDRRAQRNLSTKVHMACDTPGYPLGLVAHRHERLRFRPSQAIAQGTACDHAGHCAANLIESAGLLVSTTYSPRKPEENLNDDNRAMMVTHPETGSFLCYLDRLRVKNAILIYC